MITLDDLNQASKQEFTHILGSIYEHSPWVAQQAYGSRPFDSIDALLLCMNQVVQHSSESEKLKLIRNHPQLTGKEAERGELTQNSRKEQAGAGLNYCSREELQQLRRLNKQYLETFGFPFIIAVKGLTRHDILAALSQRIDNSREQEFETCINQIDRIASFRLDELIQH